MRTSLSQPHTPLFKRFSNGDVSNSTVGVSRKQCVGKWGLRDNPRIRLRKGFSLGRYQCNWSETDRAQAAAKMSTPLNEFRSLRFHASLRRGGGCVPNLLLGSGKTLLIHNGSQSFSLLRKQLWTIHLSYWK